MSDDRVLLIRKVKVKKLDDEAIIPTVSQGNVGFDLSCISYTTLLPGKVTKISTGLAFADSLGYSLIGEKLAAKAIGVVPFFKIEGRSGLASKGIFPVGGIIDPSYRGEICVLLFNSTDYNYNFHCGERIAQLVCYHSLSPLDGSQISFEEVMEVSQSDRGDKGFGSSGA